MKVTYLFITLIFISLNSYCLTKDSVKDSLALKKSMDLLEAKREKFNPERNAEEDLQNAVVKANKNNTRILLDIGGEWCIWCHRLDYFFLSNKDIYNLLHDNFVVVKINYSEENKNEEFLSRFPKIKGYPHIIILDKNGNLLHSENTGDLESGKGYSREKVIDFLNKWIRNKS